MIITSRNNPAVKYILSLREKKYRRENGAYIIEGIKQVREAQRCGCRAEYVVVSENYGGETFYTESVLTVSESVFAKLSEEASPQGILAVLRIPENRISAPRGNALLLDGVSDPGNLGTILRTANAAGYEDVFLKNCADPYSSKCVRAAMSGIFFVRIHGGGTEEIVGALAGVPLICADMNGQNAFCFTPPEKFCLVIGNEANGVSAEIRSLCDNTVKIPMRESCESLNAGVSAGILMYELAKRQKDNN